MAIGERFRSGGAHGIARFLAEHQGCSSGFDVRRDRGGKLSITCEGCGASVEYQAAEAGELAAGGPQARPMANGAAAAQEPQAYPPQAYPPQAYPGQAYPQQAPPPPPPPWNQSAQAPPPPPAARPAGMPTQLYRPRPSTEKPRGRVVPGWLSVGIIAALILGGLTMIGIGLTKEDEEQPADTPPAGQTPAQNKPARGQKQQQNQQQQNRPGAGPNQQQQNQPAAGQQQQPGGGQSQAPASGGAAQGAGTGALSRRTFQNRFSIGVPGGWESGKKEGAIALTARGATAEILVFFQRGETPLPELARGARDFLAERHAGAQVGGPKPTRIGLQRGLRIVATYRGGEEVAVVLSAKGYSHVILRRVDRGASPDLGQQAEAALASFKPR
jgi:hypothetical protein